MSRVRVSVRTHWVALRPVLVVVFLMILVVAVVIVSRLSLTLSR